MVERRLHQFLEGASLPPDCVCLAPLRATDHFRRLLTPTLQHSITPSLRFYEFRDRLVLDREIDRIRNIAKFVGPLVERFGLFG